MSDTIISKIEDLENFMDGYDYFPSEDNAENIYFIANIISHCNISLKYNHVTTAKSNIHGVGVFATQNIPKNRIITFYPANAVFLYDNQNEKSNYICPNNTKDFLENIDYYKEYYTLGGSCKLFDEYGLTADPNKKDNSLFLGHLLNDGIGNLFKDISYNDLHTNPSIYNQIFKQYQNSNNVNANLELLDEFPIGFIVSNKNIKKGEELLTFYDIPYWYGTQYKDCKNILDDLKKLQSSKINM